MRKNNERWHRESSRIGRNKSSQNSFRWPILFTFKSTSSTQTAWIWNYNLAFHFIAAKFSFLTDNVCIEIWFAEYFHMDWTHTQESQMRIIIQTAIQKTRRCSTVDTILHFGQQSQCLEANGIFKYKVVKQKHEETKTRNRLKLPKMASSFDLKWCSC